jgi:hypothetical protein
MRRELHVRFCEGGGVKLPSATRRNIYVRTEQAGQRVRCFPVCPESGHHQTTVAFPVSLNDPPTLFPSTWSRQLAPNGPAGTRPRPIFACLSSPLGLEMLIHLLATDNEGAKQH